ncbi:LssY C-terminal domain-containing protein [Paraburkholderia sp. IMGN_8]|uniref:LssY C-terminal domain-containing protein n=1 Tax=Paraburkholderia sp. IMGN_8 TaxID=3136564 RepID=UPI00310135D1
MLSAIIFYTFLFLALVIVPVGLILVVLLLLDHERRLWQSVTAVAGHIGAMMAQRPVISGLLKRFPRTADFLGRRLDSHAPWGLPATVAGVGILFGLWFFLGVLQHILANDPLVALDIRLHNAVPLFRTTGMTWFMITLTQMGSAAVLSLLCAGIAALALAREQRRLAATFMLALAGTALISAIAKALVGYARPTDAIISVQEASFPSGHMLSGTVVYGLLAALLLGSRVRRGVRALGITLLLLVIVGIGLSRLYLGVHWPSDLLGSLALALILLACLFFFQHHDHPVRWIDTFPLPLRSRVFHFTGSAVLVIAIGTTAILTSRTKMVLIGPPPVAHALDIHTLRTSLPPDLPRWSEDLIGGRMEPISLVFVGSEIDLVDAFTRAGWTRADLPTPLRVVQEALAALRNQPDLTGPATPAFFANRPQNLTFEKPDAGSPSIRRRHHTRLWRTTYCLVPSCRPVWVATASYDVGVSFSQRLHLPTHRIDPAIDNERTLIATDLHRAGATLEGSVMVAPPLHGMNAAGDPFSTDGRAVVLVLPGGFKSETQHH